MKETAEMHGRVHMVLRGPDGKVKDERKFHNLVVTAGKSWLASFVGASTAPANMGYIAVGTGTTAPVVGDTALQTEAARVAATRSNPSAGVVRWVGTFAAGTGTGAITESGVFNASSAGTMLARQTFPVINKGANDTLEITWELTFS